VRAHWFRSLFAAADDGTRPTLGPIPSLTPTPSPAPTPTPFPPAAGPVPQGARPWSVTLENKSSKAATLFLAREPPESMGDLRGSVTPDVVPAGVTKKVIFQLPPKNVNDCWLMIWPGPDADGDFGPTDDLSRPAPWPACPPWARSGGRSSLTRGAVPFRLGRHARYPGLASGTHSMSTVPRQLGRLWTPPPSPTVYRLAPKPACPPWARRGAG
jgi:hypothetical protein